MNRARLVDLRSASGLIVGHATMIPCDAARIRRVVERIVLGLLWHHYTARLAPGAVMQTYFKPNLDGISDILTMAPLGSIGNTVFRYRHTRTVDDLDCSIWGLQFYERAHFVVLILSQSFQARERETSSTPADETTP